MAENIYKLEETILKNIGGSENIKSYTHCATRLRFQLINDSKVGYDALKSTDGVLGVINKGGQTQIIIGPAVEQVYHRFAGLLKNQKGAGELALDGASLENSENASNPSKTKVVDQVLAYISGSIQPTLPVLISAGMISALLAIAVTMGMDNQSLTYTTLIAVVNVGFAFLPVFVAFSAARHIGTNEFIAAFISLITLNVFNQQAELNLFNLAVPNIKYMNSIIPVLLMVPLLYVVDRLCDKYIPSVAHFTLKSLIMVVVCLPAMLVVFGPVGSLIGGGLANACIWLLETTGPIALAVLSALHPITVMFGMHYLFTPIMTNEVAMTGYSFVLDRALAANFAMAGAAFAVGFKAKKSINKSSGFSSGVTALLSVTEPALYGCLVRLKRPLIAACAAAGISGAFLGIFKVKAYAIASPNLLSLPIFIGGEGMSNFVLACAGALLAFVLGFGLTYVMGFSEEA
ncbi:PTS transporter subunit EIIC [Trichococcus sp. K1Tr]|uniref:PTS transporter subunit EIIC n=1 Tax=Trichococcus sp. K1Tr TaxID=3020847 RepID=UPI002331559D|nr:PTS transporter subunit EIIC [Trichococcus sp. K1Tr]MDB6353895.1 PTS transporter subunit EIIC [Trichococcus sp. K1Tr]